MIGIYKIQNEVNNKIYIGSSKDIKHRWNSHISCLRNNRHGNIYLQRAWDKYGKENFTFEIIILCEEFELLRYEQWFLDTCRPEYNIALYAHAPQKGRLRSKETKIKISKTLTGMVYNKSNSICETESIGTNAGEENHFAKLTSGDVLIIRASNLSQKKLAKVYNTTIATISRIINRRTWRHI